VFIGGKLFGQLPDKTETGKWYTISKASNNVKTESKGKSSTVKLVTTTNTFLSISGIEVYMKDPNGKNVMVKLTNPKQGPTVYNNNDASNPFKGKYTHTGQGVGMYWQANFEHEYPITMVKVRNRNDKGYCCPNRLAKT